jgi:UDP-N-acetylmuramate dehydrogenase
MNAGAYGSDISDILVCAAVLEKSDKGRRIKVMTAEELGLGYRKSLLQENEGIVISAVFRLKKGNQDEIGAKMRDLAEKRRAKQPLEFPSAGSFFKRPEGHYAGKLIEEAGLSGLSIGGAQVSPKHCGFIINKGNANPEDIIDLMRLVQYTVYDRSGLMLEPEVRIIK